MSIVPRRQPQWLRVWIVGLVVALLGLGFAVDFRFRWQHFGANDLVAYWSVPRALLYGHGMYNQDWHEVVQRALGFPGYTFGDLTYSTMPLWNPPPFVLLLLPIAAIPFSSAVLLWIFVGMGLFGVAAIRFNREQPAPLPQPTALVIALLVVPAINAMHAGQPTPFLAACVVFAWLAQRRDSPLAAGILIVPLLLKPHVFSVSVVGLTIPYVRRREWQPILVIATGVLLLTAVLTVMEPTWFSGWRTQGLAEAPTLSLWDRGSAALGLPEWAALAGLPLGVLVGLWRYRHVSILSARMVGEASILSVLCSPYLWNHDVVVLLPSALWLATEMWRPWWRLLLFVPSLLLTGPLLKFDLPSGGVGTLVGGASQALRRLTASGDMYQIERFILAMVLYVFLWRIAVRRRAGAGANLTSTGREVTGR